jgi:hypothetical protein
LIAMPWFMLWHYYRFKEHCKERPKTSWWRFMTEVCEYTLCIMIAIIDILLFPPDPHSFRYHPYLEDPKKRLPGFLQDW